MTEVATLSSSDVALLARLETTIERGLGTFLEVGSALMEIRDKRLYRETHGRFEDYCQERWGFKRNYANKLIASAEVVALVEPMGTTVPTSERQARELAPLLGEPEQLREAWEEASANGSPTTAKVRETVRRRRPVMEIPIDEDLLEKQQRQTLVEQLDRAVYSLEGPPSTARAEAARLLAEGDPGPFTPSRFDRVAAYATAFAAALREAGIDG